MRSNPKAELILVGRYDEAGVEAPIISPGDVIQIVRAAYNRAARPVECPDPIHVARKHEIDVIDRVTQGAGNECCDTDCIRFRWDRSRRVRGSRVMHGLAHCLCDRAGFRDHEEADAVIVCAELALPTEYLHRCPTLEDAMKLSRHAERWLLRAQMLRASRWKRAA